MNLKNKVFSFDEILEVNLPSRKSLFVTENEIDKFLNYKKGPPSFFILSLLYPTLRYKEVQFHQDHIHPASLFTEFTFNKLQIDKTERDKWYSFRDMVPNLQLLEGRRNESKNSTELKSWLTSMSEEEKVNFCINNYIPLDIDFDFSNFIDFFNKRRTRLKEELKKVLAINNEIQLPDEEAIQEDEDESENLPVKEID